MTSANLGDSSSGVLAGDPQLDRYASILKLWDTVCGTHTSPVHNPNGEASHLAPGIASVRELNNEIIDEVTVVHDVGSAAHDELSVDEAAVQDILERIEAARLREVGSTGADMFVFFKTASNVSFLTGYVVEDSSGSTVRLTGAPGREDLPAHARPVEVDATTDGYYWLLPESATRARIPRSLLEFIPRSIRLPRLHRGVDWKLRIDNSPASGSLESGLKNYSLSAASELLWEREGAALFGDKSVWCQSAQSPSHYVLTESNPVILSGAYIGMRELWLDTETLRVRKLVLNYRVRGEVAQMSWCQLVCTFLNDRTAPEVGLRSSSGHRGQTHDLSEGQRDFVEGVSTEREAFR
jgi:hypothetical protein